MKSFHNLLVNVKITKNVESPSCFIIVNKFFCNPFKQFGDKFSKL